jgi:uncharacterized membrane protein YccC
MISDRFKHAFKTALAIVIAYAIALSCDWAKPYWAAYTAATVSLVTRGEGVQKGLMRVSGAICGSLAGFALLAAFIQDRWPFITALSIFSAVCVYLGSGTRRYNYFWQQAGFFVSVIAFDSAFNAANAFQLGIERTQESMTGLLTYTAVNLLLWPRDSRKDMEQTVSRLLATLHQLFKNYSALLWGGDNDKPSAELRAQATALQARFGALLDAAAVDSWEVSEVGPAWRRCQALIAELGGTMDRWRVGFADLKGFQLHAISPALSAVLNEVEGRLTEIERMLAGEPPARQSRPITLEVDKDRLTTLAHFDRAAVNVTREQIEHIERTTRVLFATISEIRDFSPAVTTTAVPYTPSQLFALDRDRLAEAWRVFVCAWLVFLAVVYIPDIPSELGMVALATRFVILEAISPTASARSMLGPIFAGVAYAFPVYIFVMPYLSSFSQLALVVFAVTFMIDYFFHQSRQAVWRALGLYMFLMLIHVTNQQSYSFTTFANSALQWLIVLGLLCVTEYVPVSQQADHVFLCMVRRFLRSSAFLLSLGWRPRSDLSRWLRWRTTFHRHEIATLPQKLGTWGQALPQEALGSTTHVQVQELVTSLQALSLRIEALIEARTVPEPHATVGQLRADVRTWRIGVEKLLVDLAADPGAGDQASLRARVDAMLVRIEKSVEAALNTGSATPVLAEDNDNMYRLLGAHRGVSEGLIYFVGHSAAINWGRLSEARF